MDEVRNILLCGVGGQGTILASKILSSALIEAGYDVKMSEIHGMSQRGGSVTTQVRYGKKVYSPIIGLGSADVLVSFEKMEAYRYLEFLNPKGKIVINDYEIPTSTNLSGDEDYPENVISLVQAKADTKVINATEIANSLGNPKCMNIVLLGALVHMMGLDDLNWEKEVRDNVKPAFAELNIKALQVGMQSVK